jgi:hypothetical protein
LLEIITPKAKGETKIREHYVPFFNKSNEQHQQQWQLKRVDMGRR